jgi:hypothetical protein
VQQAKAGPSPTTEHLASPLVHSNSGQLLGGTEAEEEEAQAVVTVAPEAEVAMAVPAQVAAIPAVPAARAERDSTVRRADPVGAAGQAKGEHLRISRPLEPRRLRTAASPATRSGAAVATEPEPAVAVVRAAEAPMEARRSEDPPGVPEEPAVTGAVAPRAARQVTGGTQSMRPCGSKTRQGASKALPIHVPLRRWPLVSDTRQEVREAHSGQGATVATTASQVSRVPTDRTVWPAVLAKLERTVRRATIPRASDLVTA